MSERHDRYVRSAEEALTAGLIEKAQVYATLALATAQDEDPVDVADLPRAYPDDDLPSAPPLVTPGRPTPTEYAAMSPVQRLRHRTPANVKATVDASLSARSARHNPHGYV